ncbi:hypothetical protein D3C80_1620690 [compost metagenome]
MLRAISPNALHVLEFLGLIAIQALDTRKKVLIHFKGLVIGLAVLESTTLPIALWGPRHSATVRVQEAD